MQRPTLYDRVPRTGSCRSFQISSLEVRINILARPRFLGIRLLCKAYNHSGAGKRAQTREEYATVYFVRAGGLQSMYVVLMIVGGQPSSLSN